MFTKNEVLEMMYEDKATALRAIADHILRWKMDHQETAKLLREIADEHEAQAIVVRLRDELNDK